MSLLGGLMQHIVKAVTTAGALELLGKTSTVTRLIDEINKRAAATADFLEKIEKAAKENATNDLFM